MKEKSSSDYFGSFLKSVQEPEEPESLPSNYPLKLMSILAEMGPTDTTKLMAASGLGLEDFTTSIRFLRKAGLIDIEGEGAGEIIKLEEIAQKMVRAIAFSAEEAEED